MPRKTTTVDREANLLCAWRAFNMPGNLGSIKAVIGFKKTNAALKYHQTTNHAKFSFFQRTRNGSHCAPPLLAALPLLLRVVRLLSSSSTTSLNLVGW